MLDITARLEREKEFVVNDEKIQEGSFRFCGKGIEQFPGKRVRVTCRHATEEIGSIRYHVGNRRFGDPASEAGVGQMRSVVGSLGWIARQCRPDLSYAVSKGQGAVSKATVSVILTCVARIWQEA